MTSTFGHIMKTEFSANLNQNQCDPLEFYNCPIQKLEANPKQKTLKVIKTISYFLSYIVKS